MKTYADPKHCRLQCRVDIGTFLKNLYNTYIKGTRILILTDVDHVEIFRNFYRYILWTFKLKLENESKFSNTTVTITASRLVVIDCLYSLLCTGNCLV